MQKLIGDALTFDDVLLVPAASKILPKDANLETKLTRNLTLNIPLLSAAMDTVTQAKLAIALAQEGGIGIIHKNMSIENQAQEVRKVKRFESGIIADPITATSDCSVQDLLRITHENNISSVPIVGKDNTVLGIVTKRDLRFETNFSQLVTKIMTPKERLITILETDDRAKAIELMHHHRLERIIVVNKNFQLRGMITVTDILKAKEKPCANKDKLGHLLVGAAVGVKVETFDRVAALVAAGVDVVVVDTAHGHAKSVIDQVKFIKEKFKTLQVIAGNIATAAAAQALADVGVDAVKVGIGPGSICTTRIISGVGVPQITAIHNVANALKGTNIPVIADGGIRFSGDITKAIAAGADSCMIGGLFAGTDEAPGEIELYKGRSYKSYRGMGSLGAMAQGSCDRYFQDKNEDTGKFVPEGIEGRIPYKGSVLNIIYQLIGGLRSGMGYTGSTNITDLKNKTQFYKISSAGINESHVHDVSITKQAPNYWLEN